MLPYRFSFLVSFTVAVMAYQAYTLAADMDWWDILSMAVSAAAFLAFAAIGVQERGHILWCALLCAVYIGVFAVAVVAARRRAHAGRRSARERKQPIKTANYLAAVLLLVAVTEFGFSAYFAVETVRTTERGVYPHQYQAVSEALALREPMDNGFYRTDSVNWYTINDPSLYGYDGGLTIFSSTVNKDTTAFLQGLGLYAGLAGNRYVYSQATPVADAFLNMRYLVSRNGDIPDDGVYWERAGTSKDGASALLENRFYLPFGFMVREDALGYAAAEKDAFASQNDLFQRATGLGGELFEKFDIVHVDYRGYDVSRHELGSYSFKRQEGVESGSLKWNYEMPADGTLYIYISIDRSESLDILLNEKKERSRRCPYPVAFCAGVFEKGDLVSVFTELERASGSVTVYAAVMDDEMFRRGYGVLADEPLELTEFSETYIKGTVTAKQDGLLYMSLPYEKGWRAYVDGEACRILTIGGSMAALRLAAGEHDIELRYINDGLVLGAVITAVSLVAFAVMVLFPKHYKLAVDVVEDDDKH